MLTFERLHHKDTGVPLAGFFVRNHAGKVLAMGADSTKGAHLILRAKRYEHDRDLVAALERMTGIKARL